MGLVIVVLMGIAYGVSTQGLGEIMKAPAVFAFGLVAFGFLGMGPVTIAVDSYGPVTDNAQSVYELSVIETIPNIKEEIKKTDGFDVNFEHAKHLLEENDGAGNTFKATAKPVLIGTAVVGATTMIFSIIMVAHPGPHRRPRQAVAAPPAVPARPHHRRRGHLLVHRRLDPGGHHRRLPRGRVHQGQHQARSSVEKASIADSKKVVEICTQYAQKGMFNIFLTVFFCTLAFACLEPFFFIGYLISIALFGLYQAIFMANAGGAWDNAKKIVEVELKEKGTALHAATVVGDTVGDPFKDTSSVAMNPVIKFTTLFGLLAVELAVGMSRTTSLALCRRLPGHLHRLRLAVVLRHAHRERRRRAGRRREGPRRLTPGAPTGAEATAQRSGRGRARPDSDAAGPRPLGPGPHEPERRQHERDGGGHQEADRQVGPRDGRNTESTERRGCQQAAAEQRDARPTCRPPAIPRSAAGRARRGPSRRAPGPAATAASPAPAPSGASAQRIRLGSDADERVMVLRSRATPRSSILYRWRHPSCRS